VAVSHHGQFILYSKNNEKSGYSVLKRRTIRFIEAGISLPQVLSMKRLNHPVGGSSSRGGKAAAGDQGHCGALLG
jgi:hypothetical protein